MQHRPPALVAAFPPMVLSSTDDGSGGYQRPCAAAADFTSAVMAPGPTTATLLTGSTVMSRIRSRLRVTPPSMPEAPPDREDPAPRATTGTPCSRAHFNTFWTSDVHVARTTALGVPARGSLARS